MKPSIQTITHEYINKSSKRLDGNFKKPDITSLKIEDCRNCYSIDDILKFLNHYPNCEELTLGSGRLHERFVNIFSY